MGLDSVELLIDFENYFNVSIPDEEACTMTTIQSAVDCIGKHLDIVSDKKSIQLSIFNSLNDALIKFNDSFVNLQLTSFISAYYDPTNDEQRTFLEQTIKLDIPLVRLKGSNSKSLKGKLSQFFTWGPTYDWSVVTVAQFIDAICANNLDAVIDRTRISDKYEIYLAVSRLTVEKVGVDYLGISYDKSFTSDLGID